MKLFLGIIVLFSTTLLVAQEKEDPNLSGCLSFDSHTAFEQTKSDLQFADETGSVEGRKSPFLAGALSFAIPGAGEVYTGNYIKAAIFLAVEVAGVVTAIMYNGKGDDKTDEYEGYANEHWSAARYAKWTLANLETLNPDLNPEEYNNVFIDDARTQVNWNALNDLEEDVSKYEAGQYYSHKLAPYGDQQYYEMIGKYPQFNVGWDDFGDESTEFEYGDPVTKRFEFYSGERGKANDFYDIASAAVKVLVGNHIISAVDAAWSAGQFNKNLEMKMNMKSVNLGFRKEYYPELNVRYNF